MSCHFQQGWQPLFYLHSTSKNQLNSHLHAPRKQFMAGTTPSKKILKWRVYPLQNQLLLLHEDVPLFTGIAQCFVIYMSCLTCILFSLSLLYWYHSYLSRVYVRYTNTCKLTIWSRNVALRDRSVDLEHPFLALLVTLTISLFTPGNNLCRTSSQRHYQT